MIHYEGITILKSSKKVKLYFSQQVAGALAATENEEVMDEGSDCLTEAVIAVATTNPDPAYNRKLLSYVSKNLEALSNPNSTPDIKRVMGA